MSGRGTAQKYGINLRGAKIVFDPKLPPGTLGTTRAAEGDESSG
jgi:hypothetical protein